MDIVIPLFDDFEPLDAVGPYQVLGYLPGAVVRFVSTSGTGRVVDTLGGLRLDVPARYEEVESCDVLLVPGGNGARPLLDDAGFTDWIRRVHATTRFTTSVCTGALLLGAAGLLKGLVATTHWAAAGELAAYGATYTPERVVRRERIVTAAGVSSGIDMALRLVALLADETTARAIQLHAEYDPQPPFDSGSPAKASPAVLERIREIG
ncbi:MULTISPECIES: DJ-1/PfpI family protein [unclassified Streptomyces]|uniref:DJ-1/PfpI family protein n=1 Tax=Streptomycetaceae TaxID=2062 RepID=UPI002E77E5A6|nr:MULTISPECIES: DJ-1/PfpI family protein [unclassified Streptomyces]MED7951641.1 DJ-1/PfpI family protein [Streptomyces sp. BE303]MEE1829022.1 DJ-1/PfpI family protein [Streptomyces sp. BE20]